MEDSDVLKSYFTINYSKNYAQITHTACRHPPQRAPPYPGILPAAYSSPTFPLGLVPVTLLLIRENIPMLGHCSDI